MKNKSIGYKLSRLLNRRPACVCNSVVDKRAKIGNGAQIVNSVVGKYTYVYNSEVLYAEIGAFCSVAEGCVIGGGKHPIDWVSTSPVFIEGKNSLNKNFANISFDEFVRTSIGNDVWIGSDCLIKGGVTIGDGAIIGMGSVVTHNVPPYEIWGGNPARLIRKRFDDETIARFIKAEWWKLSDEKLNECGELFSNPGQLLDHLEEHKDR